MVLGKVKRILFKNVKRDAFSKIVKELKTNFFFDFGHYKRCYPDNPKSTIKGFFQMEIDNRHDNTFLFKIEAVEGDLRMNTNYLNYYYIFEDEKALWFFRMNTNYLHYYNIFEEEKALWFHIKNFLSKHTNLESLSREVYKKFGFLRPREASLLFTHYNLLKDDLPDGTEFEDFLDEFKSMFKNF